MAKINFKDYAAGSQNAVAQSLLQFVKEGEEQGFELVVPKGVKGIVFKSKAGNPQIAFRNDEGQVIFVRISAALDAALSAKEDGISLPNQPVYHVDLDNGGKMLVVGMKGDGLEFVAADPKKMAKYAVSERPAVTADEDGD
jgi:hypothetical protein